MLALAIGSVPAAFAADPEPTVKTIVSGTAPVTYSIPSIAGSGDAVVVPPNSRYGPFPGSPTPLWINTSGSLGCDQACPDGTLPVTAFYSTEFELPAVSSASLKIEIMADNSAVSFVLNDTVIPGQQSGDIYANYQTVSTFGPASANFVAGTNILTIENQDFGGANGIAFRVTVTYTPAPLVISFVTPASRPYNGTTDADITSCDVAPSAAGLACAPVASAKAAFDTRNAGANKTVTAAVGAFTLSGPLLSEYTQVSVASTTAAVTKAPLTVTAVANVKTADGNTSAAAIPSVTGTIYSPDTAAFFESYGSAAADSGKTLTPAGIVTDGNDGNNYSYDYVAVSTGRIRPAAVASIAFSGQPIDTQVSTPIYSVCVPSATGTVPNGTPPCVTVSATGSSPVTVTARDAFTNLAGPGSPGSDGTTAAITITIKETGQAPALGTTTTSNGVASFGDSLLIGATRVSTTLAASATASVNAASASFRVVSDLAACDGATCDSLANFGGTGSVQKSYGRIKTTGDFFIPGTQNVILTTQFSGFEQGQCAAPGMSLGQTSEVRVDGTGVTATSPGFSVTLIYPKDTIKKAGLTARNADSYDVCLGATWLDTGSPVAWQAKNLQTGALQPSVVDASNSKLYWGWVPTCSAIQSSNLTPTQKAANPCITLRTKQAATLKTELVTKQGMTNTEFNALGARDSDVMIVVSKPWPWDGKFGTGLR